MYVPKKNKFEVDGEKFMDTSATLSNTRTVKHSNIDPRREKYQLDLEHKERMLAGKSDWDKSSEVDHTLKQNIEYTLRDKSLKNSQKTNDRTQRATVSLSNTYTTPIERERQRLEQNRLQKLETRRTQEEEAMKITSAPKVYRLGLKERHLASLMAGTVRNTESDYYTMEQDEYNNEQEYINDEEEDLEQYMPNERYDT
jgi:hypothetical protein